MITYAISADKDVVITSEVLIRVILFRFFVLTSFEEAFLIFLKDDSVGY